MRKKATKKVICSKCNQPIDRRADLVIAGKIPVPFHKQCYQTVRKRFPYLMSWPLNGPAFWRTLIGVNLLLTAMLFAFDDAWKDIRWFFLVFNLPMLIFRLLAYISYEKSL